MTTKFYYADPELENIKYNVQVTDAYFVSSLAEMLAGSAEDGGNDILRQLTESNSGKIRS